MSARIKSVIAAFVMAACLHLAPAARACAACFGQSDSKLAEGMNYGILSLLLVVVAVLGAISAFFIFLARRSASHEAKVATPD